VIHVKNGADKRRATSTRRNPTYVSKRGLIHGDEIPRERHDPADVDFDYFSQFLKREFNENTDQTGEALPALLEI